MSVYRLGIDIGGTFTDAVLIDETGNCSVAKYLTTPDNPARGAMDAVHRLLESAGVDGQDVQAFIHGTTLVANALIERKGAPTGLLTTRGFRDTLHLRRELRYDSYDLNAEFPEPLIPREWIAEVDERILADGTVWKEIDLASTLTAIQELVTCGVMSIAICLLHSYRNPRHEQIVGQILIDNFPEISVSLSSEILPEFREFERTSTTVANAYVMPAVKEYLGILVKELMSIGYQGDLHIMLSAGAITDAKSAQLAPIRIAESGPAAGALATGYYGRLVDLPHLIAFDMGGTTAKASIVDEGRPLMAREFEVARVHRFRKGSGIPLRLPVLDMMEIGAGGGSIARLDQLGLLKVGPHSAGANPGPACYGRGGSQPTVTDADLLLGYLNPHYFAGGYIQLDQALAEAAVYSNIAESLGIDTIQAAWGIYRVVNENMASAMRVYLAEKGRDPRRYSLVAFGGAGPMHVREVARALHINSVLCPPGAGVLSAIGLLITPPALDLVQTYYTNLERINWDHLNALFARLERQAQDFLGRAMVTPEQIVFSRFADMRFAGQAHEITIPVPPGPLGPTSRAQIEENFYTVYDEIYGRGSHHAGSVVQALTWRLQAVGPTPDIRPVVSNGPRSKSSPLIKGKRPAYFGDSLGFLDCTVYDRYVLHPGFRFTGPALVEEHESLAVFGPGDQGWVDAFGNLFMEIN